MKYRDLGDSGISVSEICLGSWLTYGVGVIITNLALLIWSADVRATSSSWMQEAFVVGPLYSMRSELLFFGVSLLLIDPIVSAVAGDMHRANDVRRSLQAVVDFADAHGCAVIGITHFAKGGAGKAPQDRVIGSQAFGALAAAGLAVAAGGLVCACARPAVPPSIRAGAAWCMPCRRCTRWMACPALKARWACMPIGWAWISMSSLPTHRRF